jgi:Mg-chelatase subunit ChlD
VKLSGGGDVISLSVSTTLPTTLLKLAGIKSLTIGVDNEVTRADAVKKMHIVLALDNTGSMASAGKMTALKNATHKLLDTLESAVEADGDIRVSIVPFAREVNVGAGNYMQDWLNWSAWGSAAHNTWNGCVMDRNQDYDTNNSVPNAASPATLFWPSQSPYCPTRLLPLTTNWSSLHSKVNAMIPVGNTNTTIGLVWAWQALTGGAPLHAPAASADTQRIIIFMTDGDNTQNRWTTSGKAIDARMEIACENVKDDGITLYTVLMIQGNATLLENCASDSGKFFKIAEANQVVTVFEAIATQLTNLHLSK